MLWIAPTEKYTANAAYAARPSDANNQRLGISELRPEDYSGGCRQGPGLGLLPLADPCADGWFDQLLNRPKTDRFPGVPLSTD